MITPRRVIGSASSSREWYSHDVAAIRSIWATASRLRHEGKDCPIYVEVCCDHTGPSPQQPITPLCHWSNKSGSETRAALAGLRSAGDVHILRYIHTSKMHNTHCCEPADTIGNVTRRVEFGVQNGDSGLQGAAPCEEICAVPVRVPSAPRAETVMEMITPWDDGSIALT